MADFSNSKAITFLYISFALLLLHTDAAKKQHGLLKKFDYRIACLVAHGALKIPLQRNRLCFFPNTQIMCAVATDAKPGFVVSLLQNKCPRCRRGAMYKFRNMYNLKHLLQMHDTCPVCGQPLNMEPGFYYGTNMISYVLAVLICVVSFLVWWATLGFSLSDKRFFWWLGANAVLLLLLQPPLMRLSRTVWLAFFVRYSPNWSKGDIVVPERTNKDQMNNW